MSSITGGIVSQFRWALAGILVLFPVALTALSPPPSFAASVTVQKRDLEGGTVVSSPPGIDCGSTCSANFSQGATVSFTATAAPGYTFTGWSSYGCGWTNPCTVRIGAAGTLVANFTTGFSLNDLAGSWYFLGLADSTGGNDPYWSWATLTLNAAGDVTSGTYTNSLGQSGVLTPGLFEIYDAGLVSGAVTVAGGVMSLFGKLDVNKGVLPMLITTAAKPGLGVALKGGGSFSTADLAGTWVIEDFGDSDTSNDPISTSGTITLNNSGSGTGSVTLSSGPTVPISGSFSITGAGVVTGSFSAGEDTLTFPHGKLDAGKTVLALVRTGSDSRGLTLLTKSGGSFSAANLAGTWYVANRSDALSTNNPYWSWSMVTLDSGGRVIGGGYTNSFDNNGTITGGSFTVSGTGSVQGSVNKLENGATGIITFPHGKMAPNKTVVVMASSDSGSIGQMVAVKGVSAPSLTVSKQGTGAGTVTSNPSGINCGATCSKSYIYGTSVTLTVTAATGSSFTGWSGAGCTGTGTCTVSMTQPRTVTATFSLPTHTLAVTVTGSSGGSVTSSPPGISGCTGTCAASFTSGTVVTLTANPGTGGTFRQWRGVCTGTASTCQVTMNAAKTVTAVFSKTFTDATLTAHVTEIKAVHFTDLRAAINTLRSHYPGLQAFAWTDPILKPEETPVKRAHLIELRTALDQAYAKATKTHAAYTDPAIVAGQTVIKANHLSELRTFVRGLE